MAYVETWKYEWDYKIKTNTFVVYKRRFLWNGKKQKPIKGGTSQVIILPVNFHVPIIHGTKEVTRYDFGAWSVSEHTYVEHVPTITFDRSLFTELYNQTLKELPPQHFNS